jgi:hypothetical protein
LQQYQPALRNERKEMSGPAQSSEKNRAFFIVAALALAWTLLLACGLWYAPGLHDNDWPLLMWLAKQASWSDSSPLAIGHYGFAQQLLARLLGPVFGSTVVATKVISTTAAVAACWLAGIIARDLTGSFRAQVVATGFVLLSTEVILTAQSEFADPAPTLLYLSSVLLLWRCVLANVRRRQIGYAIGAGVCLGVAAWFRIHFQVFGVMTLLLFSGMLFARRFLPGHRADYASAWVAISAFTGFGIGALPMLTLYWVHHRAVFSPVAQYFVGQALLGFDSYYYLETYANYPFAEVLRDHPGELIAFMFSRVPQIPLRWVAVLLIAGFALLMHWRKRDITWLFELLLLACAAGYIFVFVLPAWEVAWRVLYPLAFIATIAGAVGLERLIGERHPGRVAELAAAAVVVVMVALPMYRNSREQLDRVRQNWSVSVELCEFLRQHGMRDAREAFVFAWNRYVVDDPELIPYYNFGFWNLLLPAFQKERPSPIRHMTSTSGFADFMRAQNVRFVVIPKDMMRFPFLGPVVSGQEPLPGYRRAAELTLDVVYVAESS